MTIADTSTIWLPIREVRRWVRNPNRHPPAQIAQLIAGFRRFGFVDPIILARIEDEGVTELRSGEGRLMALEAALKEDPNFTPKGSPGPGLVRSVVHDFATRAAADAYGLAANQIAKISEMDAAAELAIIEDMQQHDVSLDGMGWSEDELADMLGAADFDPVGIEEQPRLDEVKPKMVTCPACGEVFNGRDHATT